MVINTKEELSELNEVSNIIHRFLAEGQLNFNFSLNDEPDEYGLEHVFTLEDYNIRIIANTQRRIYFEVIADEPKLKKKKVKTRGLRASSHS